MLRLGVWSHCSLAEIIHLCHIEWHSHLEFNWSKCCLDDEFWNCVYYHIDSGRAFNGCIQCTQNLLTHTHLENGLNVLKASVAYHNHFCFVFSFLIVIGTHYKHKYQKIFLVHIDHCSTLNIVHQTKQVSIFWVLRQNPKQSHFKNDCCLNIEHVSLNFEDKKHRREKRKE